MTRFTSFGPLVSFFFTSFFLHTDYVYIFIGPINVWRDVQEGTKKKMGPNNMFRVVWAISKRFFYYRFFLHILIILQLDLIPLRQMATSGRQQHHQQPPAPPAMTPAATQLRDERQGHREVMRGQGLETIVSQALGTFFSLFLWTIFSFQSTGPKRRCNRRLGPSYCNTHNRQHGHVTTPSHQHQA